jgi:hypothetical protein
MEIKPMSKWATFKQVWQKLTALMVKRAAMDPWMANMLLGMFMCQLGILVAVSTLALWLLFVAPNLG